MSRSIVSSASFVCAPVEIEEHGGDAPERRAAHLERVDGVGEGRRAGVCRRSPRSRPSCSASAASKAGRKCSGVISEKGGASKGVVHSLSSGFSAIVIPSVLSELHRPLRLPDCEPRRRSGARRRERSRPPLACSLPSGSTVSVRSQLVASLFEPAERREHFLQRRLVRHAAEHPRRVEIRKARRVIAPDHRAG